MKLDGRRESSNVEDRRGLSGGKVAGIGGIGAVIIAALFAWTLFRPVFRLPNSR